MSNMLGSVISRYAGLCLMIVAMALSSMAQSEFQQPPSSYGVGFLPQAMAVGDFNGDGFPDVATADFDGTVSVLLNKGDGTFGPAVLYNAGKSLTSIAAVDLNGDGKLDLVVTDAGTNAVNVLLGNGDGTFQGVALVAGLSITPDSVLVADLNGDGIPDLAIGENNLQCDSNGNCNNYGSVDILLTNPDGTFQGCDAQNNCTPVSYSLGGGAPTYIASGDFNNDGHPDLVLVSYCSNAVNCSGSLPFAGTSFGSSVTVLLNNGDGTFRFVTKTITIGGVTVTAPITYNLGTGATSVAVADMNGDGNLDLVVSSQCGSDGSCMSPGNVTVFFGNGDGTLESSASYAVGFFPQSLSIADVDGDGHPDVIVANECGNGQNCNLLDPCHDNNNCSMAATVSVLLNNGSGVLQSTGSFNSGNAPDFSNDLLSALFATDAVAIADFNNDGKPDIAVANGWDSSVYVLQNLGIPLTITADNAMREYGQVNPPLNNVTYTGFNNGDGPASLGGTLSCTTSATQSSPVGTYPISCTGLTSNRYHIIFAPGTLSITQAPLTIAAATVSRTYGQPNPSLNNVTYSGFVNGDMAMSLSGMLSCTTTATQSSAVGTYPITCAGLSSDNYMIIFEPGTLTVTPAPLTITANDAMRQYGQANPPLNNVTYNGFVNGDMATSLTGMLSCTTAATQSSPAGKYPITCSGLSSPNYKITFVSGTLTVTPAPLTITANDAAKILDAPNPAFSAMYAGFVNGDGVASLSGTLSCTTTATTTSPVGSYPINCSGQSSPNYNITYVAGTLTITYAPVGTMCLGAGGHVILPPINADGSSILKQGRVVPAQFRVCDANGVSIGTPGVVSKFLLTGIVVGTMNNPVQDMVDTNNPDTAFRWDPSGQDWVFNIATKSLPANQTYIYTISLNDGSTIVFQFGLR